MNITEVMWTISSNLIDIIIDINILHINTLIQINRLTSSVTNRDLVSNVLVTRIKRTTRICNVFQGEYPKNAIKQYQNGRSSAIFC